MALFKCCLQDEGLWELAEEASDALERLKGVGDEQAEKEGKGKKKPMKKKNKK
jgi:hypothetical protein